MWRGAFKDRTQRYCPPHNIIRVTAGALFTSLRIRTEYIKIPFKTADKIRQLDFSLLFFTHIAAERLHVGAGPSGKDKNTPADRALYLPFLELAVLHGH